MAIKPILFNTDMVRAILAGRKTVTRRLPSKRVEEKWLEYDEWVSDACAGLARDGIPCDRYYEKEFYEQYPPYQPGDILYVRETWADVPQNAPGNMHYKASATNADLEWFKEEGWKWHPSIHMPKEAARIWLKVTDVRVERLQDITDDDAIKEGANYKNGKNVGFEEKMRRTAVERYKEIWASTIKKQDIDNYGWGANPWVWVIGFECCEKPEEVHDEEN